MQNLNGGRGGESAPADASQPSGAPQQPPQSAMGVAQRLAALEAQADELRCSAQRTRLFATRGHARLELYCKASVPVDEMLTRAKSELLEQVKAQQQQQLLAQQQYQQQQQLLQQQQQQQVCEALALFSSKSLSSARLGRFEIDKCFADVMHFLNIFGLSSYSIPTYYCKLN